MASEGFLSTQTGSSPLARGLRPLVWPASHTQRIIPARAGFTTKPREAHHSRRDHPRSRGVYHCVPRGMRARGGSSPLARGLRIFISKSSLGMGIIPARAGFTATLAQVEASGKDHPRSRGVYHGSISHLMKYGGSSPLARGLLDIIRVLVGRRWIIPARAGFTVTELRAEHGHEDHPRSRGVYAATPRMAARMVGSSPLARGLRRR